MQFSTFFAAAALSGLAAAVQLSNTVYNNITAGTSYSIGWTDATGPVTLTLKNGGANNLQTVSTITSGATTSPFLWSVPSSLAADTYAIEISDGSGTNYSPQFQLLGATASASATASSTGSASGSSTASSSLVSTSTSLIATTTANSTSSTATGASNSTASATGSSSGTSAGSSSSKTSAAAGGSKTSTAASSSSSVPASNSATEFASPLALVFLTFAAIFTLN